MGRVTLHICLKAAPNEQKEHVVRIRVTKDRQPRYWSLNLSVPKNAFNPKGTLKLRNWIKNTHTESSVYNDRIFEQYRKADAAVTEFEKSGKPPFTADDVVNYLKSGGKPDTLVDYYKARLVVRKQLAGSSLQKLRTLEQYRVALDRLTDFLTATKRLKMPVASLDKAFVQQYQRWLLENYAPNTANLKLGCLRYICREAMDAGFIAFDNYPFKGLSIVFKERTISRLHEVDLDKLAEAPRTGRQGKFYYVTDRKHARPCGMLMYYLQGMRIGDFILLRRENYQESNGQTRVVYNMGKSDKPRNVLLPPEAIDLLAPYLVREDGTPKGPKEFLFPYIIETLDKMTPADQLKYINRAVVRLSMQLKQLGEDINLDMKVSPHVMRHSFADMLRRNSVDLITIQMTLGHSDMRTTRKYMESFDLGAVDNVVNLYKSRKTIGQQTAENGRTDSTGDRVEGSD